MGIEGRQIGEGCGRSDQAVEKRNEAGETLDGLGHFVCEGADAPDVEFPFYDQVEVDPGRVMENAGQHEPAARSEALAGHFYNGGGSGGVENKRGAFRAEQGAPVFCVRREGGRADGFGEECLAPDVAFKQMDVMAMLPKQEGG